MSPPVTYCATVRPPFMYNLPNVAFREMKEKYKIMNALKKATHAHRDTRREA